MLAPRTPAAPAKATAAPTLRPAQPFMPPVRRAVAATTAAPAAARARAQAAPPAGPAQSLLAAVPAMLAPAVDALAHVARQQVPYRLLAQALGHDPLTGRAVAAAPQALAHTLLGLLPDGEARYQQLQAAGPALAQLPAWLGQQLAAHQLSGARLSQVLAETWATLKALGWRDLLDLGGAVQRLARPWVALARDVARFVAQSEGALLRFLVRAVLGEAQAVPVLKALDRGGDLLLRILRHPLPFLQHLVSAGQRGFANFLKNGPRHLLASVQDWLLGGLAKAGLHRPARLDLAGVIDVLLQLFDLTKAAVLGRLRRRLAQVIGAENMDRLEEVIARVGGVALTLFQRGPAAAWQAIREQAGDLKTQALDFVQQQVLSMATRAVPVFLATLAVPGGAFLQVAKGIYSGVMTFVEKGQQIAQVGTALLGSVSAIAAGQVAPAAQAVETTLVKVLPVALSFLAKWLGLDGISGAIRDGLKKVQAPVEKAVTKVLDVVTDKAKAVWGAVMGGAGKVVDKGKAVATAVGAKVAGWLGIHQEFTTVDGEGHELYFQQVEGRPQLMRASKLPRVIGKYLRDFRAYFGTVPATHPDHAKIKEALGKADKEVAFVSATATAPAKEPNIRTITTSSARLNQGIVPGAQVKDTSLKDEKDITAAITRLTYWLPALVIPGSGGGGGGGGLPPVPDAAWTNGPLQYTGGEKQYSKAEYLSLPTRAGGKPKDSTPEMAYVQDQNWVRMHLISEKLGGAGTPENWVPAPTGFNTGQPVLKSFEESAKRLLPAKPALSVTRPAGGAALSQSADENTPGSILAWVDVRVTSYRPRQLATWNLPGFVDGITFQYGLYRPPLPNEKGWVKIREPFAKQSLTVPQPPVRSTAGQVVILSNAKYANRTTFAKLLNTRNPHLNHPLYGSALRHIIVAEVNAGGVFASESDFQKRLTDRLRKLSTDNPAARQAMDREKVTASDITTSFAADSTLDF